jgi:predicted dienelactone hydrolase
VRPIEVLLLLLTCAGVARVLTPWRRIPAVALVVGGATLAAFGAHLLLERPRWQLLPAYAIALASVGLAASDGLRPCEASRRRAPAACAVALTLLGGALGWALPVVELTAPSGPYAVGTTTTTLVDAHRDDPYRAGGEPRRLALQLWYPAEEGAAPGRSAWIDEPRAFASAAAAWLDLPAFALSHLGLVSAHATRDAPAAAGTRPVVLYAHGWSGFRNIHSTQMESLASHGYVVAAVDHVPGALASVYPDGEVVPIDPAALPSDVGEDEYQDASERLVDTFADDLSSTLDHLREDPALAGRIDRGRVAMIGHSTGGGAAILACARERTCRAVVGYDPWVEPLPDDAVGAGLDRPLLSLRSEEWVGNGNDRRLRRLHAASDASSAPVAIAGATHGDFTLLPMLTPLSSRLGMSGPTGGETIHEIVDDWTVAFLDHHLRDDPDDPVESPPDHSQATVDRPLDGDDG